MVQAATNCVATPSVGDRAVVYAEALCQWSLALLVFLPFVISHHYQPYSVFFQESLALLLGLFACAPVALTAWRGELRLPRSAIVFLALALIACLQVMVLDFPVWQDVAIFVLYLTWGTLLLCVGAYLAARPELGRQTVRLLAWAILFGAAFNAFATWAQIFGIARQIPFVFPAAPNEVVGNLAQTNLLATYLALGICALIYLEAIEDFPTRFSWGILLVLVGTGFWTGSRMFVLEIVAAAILAFLPPQDRENPFWRRLRVSAGLALAFYVLWYVAKVSGLTELLFSVQFDRAGRLVNVEMGGTWIRLGLWKAAAEMVWENPWLGIGINNYDWFAFDQMKYFPAMEKTGSIVVGDAEHAHNLIMHLAAEMGIVAGVVVSVWLVRWSVRAFSSRTRGEDWWVVACGSVILIHAMLEYPLWYSYYLGLFCLLAGWRSTIWSVPRQATRRIGAAMSVVSFLGLGLLAFTASQYLAFERMVNIGPIFGGEASAVRRSAERLMTNLKNESLLSGKATYGLAFNFTLNTNNVREKAEICRRAIRWEPDRAIVFRCAVLFALEGRREEALALMDRSVLAFPSEALTVSAQLSQMAQQAPQLRPLAFELDMLIARRQRQYPQVWTPELGPSTIPIL